MRRFSLTVMRNSALGMAAQIAIKVLSRRTTKRLHV